MRAVQTFAQTLSRLEVRGVSGRKRYWRSGPGIAAKACTSETYREAAEATDLDSTSDGKVRRQVLKHHVHRQFDVSLDEMGLRLRNPLDQLRLGHWPIVPSSAKRCPWVGPGCRHRRPRPSAGTGASGTEPRVGARRVCRYAAARSTGQSRLPIRSSAHCVRGRLCAVPIEHGVEDRTGRLYRRVTRSACTVPGSLSRYPCSAGRSQCPG